VRQREPQGRGLRGPPRGRCDRGPGATGGRRAV